MDIKRIAVAEFLNAPTRDALLAGYADECAMPELGGINPQFEMYDQLEDIGLGHCIGAYEGDELIGVLFLLVSVVPHYGKTIATTESFFVHPDHRKGGAGMALLDEAETIAREQSAVCIFVTAPAGSRLERVMPHTPYRRSNAVFVRGL